MPNDEIVAFFSEDAEMDAAIRQAKQSFAQFLNAFASPSAKQKSFLVKAAFVDGEQVEHIWLADLDFSRAKPSGVVANEPGLPTLKFMQTIEFEPSQITDWMYIEDGYLVGGYTTRLIRERMSPADRSTHDANAPYKFCD